MRSIAASTVALVLCAGAAAAQIHTVPNAHATNSPAALKPGIWRNVTLAADLTVQAVRENTRESSIDVFVANRGLADAGQCQVTLQVVNGSAVVKTLIQILPPTPRGGRQVLNFPTAGWGSQLAQATGLRVLVNSNAAFAESSLSNNTFFQAVNAAPPAAGTSSWLSDADVPDLVVTAVERVPGQTRVRVRVADQGAKPEGGTPLVRVYALPARYGWDKPAFGKDSVVIDASNAGSHLDQAWAVQETHIQGMGVGQSREVVLTFPDKEPEQSGGCWLGCWPSQSWDGTFRWSSPKTFAASVFYATVSTTVEVNKDNNGKLGGPFG